MRLLPFAKVESIQNDFVLLDLVRISEPVDLPALAIRMCARRFGVGSDGLLTLEQVAGGGALGVRMFNPDGTEDFCGNGLRCAAWYARERGLAAADFELLHGGRRIRAHVSPSGSVCTTIGRASFQPEDVPLASDRELFCEELTVMGTSYQASALNTGSTHTILHVAKLPDDSEFQRVSAWLEHDPLFPQRTSVIWCVADDKHLSIRIWERGVGETMGCGTGSSAAVVAQARKHGLSGVFEVRNPGGEVQVRLDSWDGELHVKSQAAIVYEGEFLV